MGMKMGRLDETTEPIYPHERVLWFSLDKSRSIAAPPQLDRGEEIRWKAHGSRQGQGAITHQLPSQTKQTELGEKKRV